MKNNFKCFSITFDTKVKILIIVCVIVAITIIIYSFYYICINSKSKVAEEKINSIEDMLNVLAYDAKYSVTVNSNKNSNTYEVYEDIDFENNIYNLVINDSLKINVVSNNTKIENEGLSYEYINKDIILNNPISFSSIVECIKRISLNELDGKITRIEQDDKYIYQITTQEEYIEKINKIEICVLKENCKIFEIKMYNLSEKVLYSMIFESFNVKK